MSTGKTERHSSRYDRIPRGAARYGIGDWDRALGNHRAVIRVSHACDAVCAYLPWRRRDVFPQAKHVRIVDAKTGLEVTNSVVVACNREYGEVVFEPVSGPGLYYAYYLIPANDRHRREWPRWAFPITRYEAPRETAADAWREKHRVQRDDIDSPPNPGGSFTSPDPYPAPWRDLQQADMVEFQARGERHSFHPMEVAATVEERMDLVRRAGARPFLLFPESRRRPIRMTRDIPRHWAARGAAGLDTFRETAFRNEYLVFQVGVYAHRETLANVKATVSDLTGPGGARIPAESVTCFNLAGIDQRGKPFKTTLHVPAGRVQALWFGVDIPENARPGRYEGSASIAAQGTGPQTVKLLLTVRSKSLADRGDGDHARLSRLRWLNSTHAIDDLACAPFTPVEVKGREIRILGRTLELDEVGLPAGISSYIDMFRITGFRRDILAAPVRFDVVRGGSALKWRTCVPARCLRKSPAKALFESIQAAHGITRKTGVCVEMDGRIAVRVTLESEKTQELDALRLAIRMPASVSRLWLEPAPPSWEEAGPDKLAYSCPDRTDRPLRQFRFAWTGDYNAGLAISIASANGGWLKGKRGRFRQARKGDERSIVLDTGRLRLEAGAPLAIEFALYATPFKPLSPGHWDWRYCHQGYGRDLNMEEGIRAGATVFTQHHGSPNNPFISYLFPSAATLRRMAARAHAAGGRFKAYNTIRELSTRAAELWALRSLGHEILPGGAAGLGFESMAQLPLEYQLRDTVNDPFTGDAWMCEHLVDDYHSRWHTEIAASGGKPVTEDSSVMISGASRWSNFFIESQRWLMANAGVDGLYLDGATFDRESFLRLRKTLVRQKPHALIDFHGSPAEVMDYLGFIDSIWFGEGADYSRDDAYWLTAVSGIPFGVPGELLLPDAGVHRGMVYGLSHRYAWMPIGQVNPAPLWKWWDEFEIASADMLGYWMPGCPVKTSRPAVKATAYVHKGRRIAVALASWARDAVDVRLEIDWKAVGIDPSAARATAPEIPMFQPGMAQVSLDAIHVEPGKGWIIVVE